ncbi:MAG: hypothetical protein FWG65_01005 [Turicibacter sp.]|nr:hypothetical protein [Turicibacter sp.]
MNPKLPTQADLERLKNGYFNWLIKSNFYPKDRKEEIRTNRVDKVFSLLETLPNWQEFAKEDMDEEAMTALLENPKDIRMLKYFRKYLLANNPDVLKYSELAAK